jgi:hypothetical protein
MMHRSIRLTVVDAGWTGTDAVIFLVDASDRGRFDEAKHELEVRRSTLVMRSERDLVA